MALVEEGFVTDEDGTVVSGAVLRAVIAANASVNDQLLLSGTHVLVADDGDVSVDGQVIGSVGGSGQSGQPLEVTFNALASLSALRTVLQSVQFQTSGDNPLPGSRQVLLRVSDGAGGISQERQVTANVITVNDAPQLSTAGEPVLRTIWEDAKSPRGTPVSELVQGAISDVDLGALTGIAIVGAAPHNGTWQYRLAGSTLWHVMGEISAESALLLAVDAGAQVRFVPKPNFNSQVWLHYRAWDQTEGTVGQKVSLIDKLGDSHPFSVDKEGAALTVIAVNDKPILQFASNIAYQRDKPAIVLSPYARLHDVDSPNFAGGQLRIQITTGASTSNRIALGSGFTLDANHNVLRSGIIIGTLNVNGGIGVEDLVVSFNGNATQATVKELLRSITFKTVRGAVGVRKAVFSLTDGNGGTSSPVTKTINVT